MVWMRCRPRRRRVCTFRDGSPLARPRTCVLGNDLSACRRSDQSAKSCNPETSMTRALLAAAVALAVLPAAASAQGHGAGHANTLGTVHFETTCSPAIAPTFDRGVALLHSFE